MKNLLSLFSASALILALASCGSDTKPAEEKMPSKETADLAPAAQNDKSGGTCCFTQEEEFAQFLPAACGDVKESEAKYASSLLCLNDANDLSSATKSYTGSDGKRLSLQLRDYCAKQDELKSDYERRISNSKNDPVAHEFAEYEEPGVYKAYSHYSPKNKTVYVLAVVDDRFRVQITGQEAASWKDALALLKGLPLAALAKFGK